MPLDAVVAAIREIRAPVVTRETDLHALVAGAFEQANIPTHTVMIAPRCRIGFLAQGIGIEIKRSSPTCASCCLGYPLSGFSQVERC